MSKKVYDLFYRTARQCAPVIMGVKAANLLKVKKDNEKAMKKLFYDTDIELKKLYDVNGYCIYIVFKRSVLEEYVMRAENIKILFENGYKDMDFDLMLDVLSARCRLWSEKYNDFPHEIGIFLGYPTDDVREFIKNKGKNFLDVGYWKVYNDVERAKAIFESYDRAEVKVMDYFYANAYCE